VTVAREHEGREHFKTSTGTQDISLPAAPAASHQTQSGLGDGHHLGVGFCIEAVKEALAKYDKPDIVNTDQGSQFTSIDFIKLLKDAGIAISVDGKGAWRDNVFVERLWRTIKYEEVYLYAYQSVPEAGTAIGKYLIFYSTKRPHSSLDHLTGRPLIRFTCIRTS